MLEIKNLCKTYKSKGGVVVKALDDVSIKFPEKGMVFLLGKSGSGKSTLLNVTGGLDKPDSGEIIIKGRNSNTFSGADFDSYRNTFIGFIFQEYNILNEFNIEQNISLALQLQGKKNDKEAVEDILKQVDLQGYGKRKPNTLSGGQKQRIAIARALIKNPEIIMADEPTGALDSNTGKQVFDTLKKLSLEKLVIIVSHDRDFAEIYGDRIIELADGKIISDVTKETREPESFGSNVIKVNENLISIKSGKDVTEEDVKALVNIIKSHEGEVVITSGDKSIESVKQTMHIRTDNKSEVFSDTKEIKVKEYDGKQTKFIRSRLPYARALKMGASSLKTKPIRMIFTIFLTLVSLVMFGVASTLLFYDENYSISSGLESSDHTFERIAKTYNYEGYSITYDQDLNVKYEGKYENGATGLISDKDIEKLNQNNVGHKYAGVYGEGAILFKDIQETRYYRCRSVTGILDAGEEYLSSLGFNSVIGKYPTSTDEIAITTYIADAMIASSNNTYSNYDELLNKKISVSMNTKYSYSENLLKISGIYNCGSIPSKYEDLKEDAIRNSDLESQFKDYIDNSYQGLVFVTKDFHTAYDLGSTSSLYYSISLSGRGACVSDSVFQEVSYDYIYSYIPDMWLDNVKEYFQFKDASGNSIEYTPVKNNQIYLPYSAYTELQDEKQNLLTSRVESMMGRFDNLDALKEIPAEEVSEMLNILEYLRNFKYDYPADRNYNEDYNKIVTFYNTYYKDYVTHRYVISKGLLVLAEIERENKQDTIEDFYSLYSDCTEYINCNNANDSIFATLKTKLEAINGYMDYLKRAEAHDIATKIVYEYEGSSPWLFSQKTLKDNYDLANRLRNDILSGTDSEIEKMRDLGRKNPRIYELCVSYEMFNVGYDTTNLDALEVKHNYYLFTPTEEIELEVLGYFTNEGWTMQGPIMSYDYMKNYLTNDEDIYVSYPKSTYVNDPDAIYTLAITTTNYTQPQIANLLQKTDDYGYVMTNAVFQVLANVIGLIMLLRKVFLITGIVFAVFASLMLFNFISSSIASKTKEIGILRAVGARGSDLFKIFFSESGIVAIICFTLAIIASIFVCMWMNKSMSEGLGFKLLNFNILNAGIIIAGSMVIAFVGTFIPVLIASKKAPIDSIRTL